MRIESGARAGIISVSLGFVSYPFLAAGEKWLGRKPPAGPSFLAAKELERRYGRTPCRDPARAYEVGDEGGVCGIGLIGFIL